MKPLRLRVVFEDRRILRKPQRKLGLRRSWLLVRPELDTVAELASHIIHTFNLHDSCPGGLLLSMDQFALPPFESTQIFKDSDVIWVKRREFPIRETLKSSDDGNNMKVSGIMGKQPLLLCDNEEFENESGGYESENEENAMVSEEQPSDVNTGSKRKRGSGRAPKSKVKKQKKTCIDESLTTSPEPSRKVISEEVPLRGDVARKVTPSNGRSLQEENNMQKDISSTSKNKQREGQEGPMQETAGVDGNVADKKIPSRSARRKKAKRQWLRELKVTEKKEPDRSDKQEDVIHPESPIHNEDEDTSSDDEIIPVVVKPGHIRFGSSGQEEQASQLPVETLQWNGTVNKKKGQKWGREEEWNGSVENEDALVDKSTVEPVVQGENKNPDLLADFEKLPPLQGVPKKGETVAYKLVELSSSWCPELSSFRVGKVVSFDPTSSMIILDQVPGHPVSFHKITEEDDSLPDVSLYKEDGTLEIGFPSLHDVRLLTSISTNGEVESMGSYDHEPSATKNNATERVPGNAWEELSRALEQKKEELSQKSWPSVDQKQPKKSGPVPWSLRALRRSAIGPTISLLRSNNAI